MERKNDIEGKEASAASDEKKAAKEVEKLERIYEEKLKKLGIEMIEGCGLEGDWDIMTAEQKITALEAAIGECEEREAEVVKCPICGLEVEGAECPNQLHDECRASEDEENE